ncbi:hypothetical protein, partial [Aneurinibacillus danicus]|uniref:hypothetical protein n=1 Tax=Aneurinibacillus danicus TaxID=267746 RepID=UPI001C3FD86B
HINNNSNRDQHVKLYSIANNLNSVYYVLPRITTRQSFQNWVGKLIHMTTFLEVLSIDRTIGKVKVGDIHHIRVSYDNSHKEVCSTPTIIESSSSYKDLIAEIFLVRCWRIIEDCKRLLLNSVDLSNELNEKKYFIIKNYLINLGVYLGIHPNHVNFYLKKYNENIIINEDEIQILMNKFESVNRLVKEEFLGIYEEHEFYYQLELIEKLSNNYTFVEIHQKQREELFSNILDKLGPLFEYFLKDSYPEETFAMPQAEFTYQVIEDSINISIPEEERGIIKPSWEKVSCMIF